MAGTRTAAADRAGRGGEGRTATLVVDPIACDAHGLCAELLPERIALDEWGYPIVSREPLNDTVIEHARRAVAACPTLALKLRAGKR